MTDCESVKENPPGQISLHMREFLVMFGVVFVPNAPFGTETQALVEPVSNKVLGYFNTAQVLSLGGGEILCLAILFLSPEI